MERSALLFSCFSWGFFGRLYFAATSRLELELSAKTKKVVSKKRPQWGWRLPTSTTLPRTSGSSSFFLPPDPETNAALMCFRFVCDRLPSVSRDMSWNGCLELCVPAVQQLFCGRRNMKTVRAAFQFLPNCSKVLKWPKWACAVSIPVLLYALDLLFVKFLSCILWFLPRDLWTACKLSLPPREARGHVDRAIIPRMEIACSGWTSLPVSRALAKRDRLVRTIPRGQLRWRSDYFT